MDAGKDYPTSWGGSPPTPGMTTEEQYIFDLSGVSRATRCRHPPTSAHAADWAAEISDEAAPRLVPGFAAAFFRWLRQRTPKPTRVPTLVGDAWARALPAGVTFKDGYRVRQVWLASTCRDEPEIAQPSAPRATVVHR